MKLCLSCRQLYQLYSACKASEISPELDSSEHQGILLLRMHLSEAYERIDNFACSENCLDCPFQYDLCNADGEDIPFDFLSF